MISFPFPPIGNSFVACSMPKVLHAPAECVKLVIFFDLVMLARITSSGLHARTDTHTDTEVSHTHRHTHTHTDTQTHTHIHTQTHTDIHIACCRRASPQQAPGSYAFWVVFQPGIPDLYRCSISREHRTFHPWNSDLWKRVGEGWRKLMNSHICTCIILYLDNLDI